MKQYTQKWTEVIESKRGFSSFSFKDIKEHKDLLFMFIKRDIVSAYKQTILGPLWYFIQPILTTVVFTLVFGKFANLKTDIEPKYLFYFAGIIIWNYFSDCFLKVSSVLKDNASLFGKVYFPRIIIPVSIVISGLVKFVIQLTLFIIIIAISSNISAITIMWALLCTPFIVFLMASYALSIGLLITSATTRYRDLIFVVHFGVQLLMYATPIIYSTKTIAPKYTFLVSCNPLSSIVELFRNLYLNIHDFNYSNLMYSLIVLMFLMLVSIRVFNSVQKKFIDTI